VSPEGLLKYPTGLAGLRALNHDLKITQVLPEAVGAAYCGVGNPFILGPIQEGEAVLDIGCGTGVDSIMNGPKGKALTEAVVKLEAESHHMGYYKAFALTALSTGPSDSSNPGAG